MYDAYTELLAYHDIDETVERVYRAFLDTKLLEYAVKAKGDKKAYWRKVRLFRLDNLDPYERRDLLEKSGKKVVDDENAPEPENKLDERYEQAVGFLYWFDVRAEFWALEQPNAELVKILAPADKLAWLYKEATLIRSRIDDGLQAATTTRARGAQAAGGRVLRGAVPVEEGPEWSDRARTSNLIDQIIKDSEEEKARDKRGDS